MSIINKIDISLCKIFDFLGDSEKKFKLKTHILLYIMNILSDYS